MKIICVTLDNFQGAKSATSVALKDFSLLVGRNDVGKSTVLKALNCFLNGITPSADTKHVSSASSVVRIDIAFEAHTAKPIIIDDAATTTLNDEGLLDENGYAHIRKEWDVGAAKPSVKVSIRRRTYGDEDFLLLNERDLIKHCAKWSVETKKANGDEYNNVEKRQKLREAYAAKGIATSFVWEPLSTSGGGRSRQINDALKSLLPVFQYFRADTSLDETDAIIQKYFKMVAEKALKANGIDALEGMAKTAVAEVLAKVASKINEVLPEGGKIEPSVQFDWPKAVSTSFRTSDQNGGEIPLGQRGDGFRRIAMMAYFEFLAEQNTAEPLLFGFEEPETFLHPTAQEQLFEKLQSLSEAGHQVIVSSHSPIIVARADVPKLIHVSRNEGVLKYDNDIKTLAHIADDIGIRIDNQFIKLFDKAKVLLLVEGIKDVNALTFVAETYRAKGIIHASFAELQVVALPIGGCGSIAHWVQLDLLKSLSKPAFVLLDSDREYDGGPSANEERLKELGFVPGQNCAVTRKRNLENYIPCAALNRMVPGANMEYGDFDRVVSLCKAHPSKAKALGGKSVAEKHFGGLTLEELRAGFLSPDQSDEFVGWHSKVCALVPA